MLPFFSVNDCMNAGSGYAKISGDLSLPVSAGVLRSHSYYCFLIQKSPLYFCSFVLATLHYHVVCVVLSCPKKQMGRLATVSYVTCMANIKAVWKWAVSQVVGDAMRVHLSVLANAFKFLNDAVAPVINWAFPKQTAVGFMLAYVPCETSCKVGGSADPRAIERTAFNLRGILWKHLAAGFARCSHFWMCNPVAILAAKTRHASFDAAWRKRICFAAILAYKRLTARLINRHDRASLKVRWC